MTPELLTALWVWSLIWGLVTLLIKTIVEKYQIKNKRRYEFEKEFFYKKQEAFIVIDNYMTELKKYILEIDNKIALDIYDFDDLAKYNFSEDMQKVPWLIKLFFKDNEEKYFLFFEKYSIFINDFLKRH